MKKTALIINICLLCVALIGCTINMTMTTTSENGPGDQEAVTQDEQTSTPTVSPNINIPAV